MKLRHIPALAALAAAHTVAAVTLSTPNMAFEIAEDATAARFVFPRNTAADKDFWRLILDDGDRTEIPVFSHAQKGHATRDGVTLTVTYDRLVSAYGDTYDIGFTLRIAKMGDVLTFTPADERVTSQSVAFSAYIIKSDSWSEDFEPLYVVEDQTFPRRFPEGWTSTGWEITQGGGDDMMAMFGGGSGEEKSWVAKTDSKEYEMVTPRLQAKQGNLLHFTADMGGGFMQMFSMFGMGGGDISYLNVYYKRDYDKDWTLYNTYFQSGDVVFKAPYSGYYQLKFQGSGVSLDDFLGFSLPKDSVQFIDTSLNPNVLDELNGKVFNSVYYRVVSAKDNGDGTQTPVACTVSLPYDFDIDEYYAPGTAQIYQLAYVDSIYHQFIFNELPDNKARCPKARQSTISINGTGTARIPRLENG